MSKVLSRAPRASPQSSRGFTCKPAELRELAQRVLERARRVGANGCDCDVSEGHGLTVTVRKGRPDVLEHNRDRSVGVSVYFGERPKIRRGHASTSDFSPAALEQTVDAAVAIARHTAEDDCAGLPGFGALHGLEEAIEPHAGLVGADRDGLNRGCGLGQRRGLGVGRGRLRPMLRTRLEAALARLALTEFA